MTKQQVRLPDKSLSKPWGNAWQLAAGVVLLALVSAAVWWYAESLIFSRFTPASGFYPVIGPLQALTGVFVLQGLLTVGIAAGIATLMPERRWHYRSASAGSAGVYLLHSALYFTQYSPAPLLSLFAAGVFGSVAGGILLSWIHLGTWEDNQPPPERIHAAVIQVHQAALTGPVPASISKRLFDLSLSLLGILFSAPLWLLISLLVWLEDPGPVLFVKNSVGRGGFNFHQYKFRTMVHNAEHTTGPVLSGRGDDRVLFIGRLLRKTALDELPQLINILRGQMSFVGPRPQRTVLVYEYLKQVPEYALRHQVLPGLSGLAQVAGDYYLTPRQKLRFDRLYIQYAGLGFDLRLLLLAFLITFYFRWRPNWNGRLPRRLLHFTG